MFDVFAHINCPKLDELQKNFFGGTKQAVVGLTNAGEAFCVAKLGRGTVFVAKDLLSASKILEFLSALGFSARLLTNAYENSLGLEDAALKNDFLGAVLDFCLGNADFLIVLTPALRQKVPALLDIQNGKLLLSSGQKYDFSNTIKLLVKMGYQRKDRVFVRGEFAVRGDIIFLWPINQENVVRLEFFDDELEKISLILPEEKKLVKKLDQIVLPASSFEKTNKNLLSLSSKVVFAEPSQLMAQVETFEEASNFVAKNQIFTHIPKQSLAFVSFGTKSFYKPEQIVRLQCENGKNYLHNLKEFALELKSFVGSEKEIFVFCGGQDNKARLQKILEENFVFAGQIGGNSIVLLEDFLPQTVQFYDAKSIFFGTHNLFGKKKKTISAKKSNPFVPKVNDFVVHEVHGIGKCVGLEKMKLSGYEKDYIIIEYRGGDRFYLPSEQANELSLYSSGQAVPKLHKLGGAEFAKTKEKVYKSVKEMAFDLLQLYAKREKAKGTVYQKDDYLMQKFEEAFSFEETPDQLRAISDIKADMESPKIMDRLICGDVGFGKTEVALRAIFKAVLSGKQVAFLCPTTILAEQHFKTCQKRFEGFMVRTARFNRLMTKTEENKVLAGLQDGSIDVVVGTHKLLSKNVQFKNLALLVLDEEQRFGVEDKEKIKNIKENIDVLALSATPIPRTLHMSLTGIRDISIIDTPPRQRQGVQTFVTEFDETLVQSAIKQELARGGQVLIIYNNIEKIYDFAGFIKKLVPAATIGVAHGKLPQKVLEDTIIKLYAGEYQILVSTTLIENGIDLPSANTLIVVNADFLGLSQAYQIRGRIGRSDKVAYAYFLVKENKQITESAYKRLSALMENTSLGSGFKIAMADMDIRGAGNVLGKEQSGNLTKVGYDLYYKLLGLALKEVKGEKSAEQRDVKLDVSISAFVPESYVASQDERLKLISQISGLDTKVAVQSFLTNLAETIAEVPVEVENLVKISLLKNFAQKSGAKLVRVDKDGWKIAFYEQNEIKFEQKATIMDNLENVLGYFEKQLLQNS